MEDASVVWWPALSCAGWIGWCCRFGAASETRVAPPGLARASRHVDRGPGDRNVVACPFSTVCRYLMEVWLSGAGPLKKVSGDCDASRAYKGNYLLWAPLCKVQSRVLGDTKLLFPRGGHLEGGGGLWKRPGGKGRSGEEQGKVKIKNSLVAVFSRRDQGKIAQQ
jgi:hypothetical protein